MRHRFLYALIALAPLSLPAQTTLINETFANGLPSTYTVSGGTATVSGGVLTMTSACVQLPGTYSRAQGLSIEADVSINDAAIGDFNVYGLYDSLSSCPNGPRNGYFTGWYPIKSDNPTDFINLVNGGAGSTLTSTPVRLSANAAHHLKQEFLSNGTINVYIDGVLTLTVANNTYTSGLLTLRSWQAVTVDNLVVKTIASSCTSPSLSGPQSTTISAGQAATLSVTAAGTPPFTYQWFQGASGDTSKQVGTNASTFNTPSLTTTTAYWVRVSNSCSGTNTVNSSTVTVTVAPAPDFTISATPASRSITQGSTTTYTVTLTSQNGFAGAINLQALNLPSGYNTNSSGWTQSAVNLAANGTTSATYTLATTTNTSTGTFTLSFRGTNGNLSHDATASVAIVAACIAPTISTQPTSQTTTSGKAATLSVVAAGTAPFSYQWYQGPSGITSAPVNSVLSSFTTPALSTTTFYWVRVSNSCSGTNSVNSATATITITPAPDFTVTATPASRSIVQGGAAAYAITVSSLNGFGGSVSLQALNLPSGYNAAGTGWSQTSINVPANSTAGATFTLGTTTSTATGGFNLLLRATAGALVHDTPVSVTIASPPLPSGTVTVQTNLSGASFAVSGPAGISGSGTSLTIPNAPTGKYSVTFYSVSGYNTPTPNPQMQALTNGGSVVFSGTYTLVGLGVSPGELNFAYQYGTKPPIMAQALSVTTGGLNSKYSMTAASIGNWLTATTQSGTTPDVVTVSVAAGLQPKTYSGTITINAGVSGQKLIPVTLVVSTQPVTPIVPPPGTSVLSGRLDPKLPTIVLTHGLQNESSRGTSDVSLWNGVGPNGATTLLQQVLGSSKANIIRYVWDDAFQPFLGIVPTCGAYRRARSLTWNAGISLSRSLIGALPADYHQKIQFVGHSLGTIVSAYALKDFIDNMPNVPAAQFTALDRPDRVHIIPDFPFGCYDTDGFDTSWFASVLPKSRTGFQLYVDNYYSASDSPDRAHRDGVGNPTAAPPGAFTYNHPNLVAPGYLDTVINDGGDDHSGVNEWYRWTIKPTDKPFPTGALICDPVNHTLLKKLTSVDPGLDDSLDPCNQGWNASILLNPVRFPPSNPASSTTTARQSPTTSSPTSGGSCIFNGAAKIVCATKGTNASPQALPAAHPNDVTATGDSVATLQVEIPKDARFLSFQYSVTDPGSGDYASMLLDNTPIWVMSGSNATPGATTESGLIPIDGYDPGPHQLTVALHQVSDQAFGFSVDQIELQTATAYPVNIALNPPSGGTVTLDSAANAYVPGTAAQLTVVPAQGFLFTGFTGDLDGTDAVETVAVNKPVNATANFTPAVAPQFDPHLLNAASYASTGVAPGEMVTLYGIGLGPASFAGLRLDGNRVATTLAGTRVLFDGIPAPLVYAQANQVALVVPYGIAGNGTTQVQTEYQGFRSPGVAVPVLPALPGIFTADASGSGLGAIVNQDGRINSLVNPAAAGSIITFYFTGAGQTNPSGTDGLVNATPLPKPILPIVVAINNTVVATEYLGAAPSLIAGVMQVNVRLPQTAPSGLIPLTIGVTVNGQNLFGNSVMVSVAAVVP